MVYRCHEAMAYLAPLVRGFVRFVNVSLDERDGTRAWRAPARSRSRQPFDGTDETRAGRPTTRDPGQDLQSLPV